MEKRLTFNTDEEKYDKYRPLYPSELYADILDYCGKKPRSAIEIGIGTGQATLPFLENGIPVTAVELGDRLSAFAAKKYGNYRGFRIITGDFMTVSTEADLARAELIYCATAFHWLPNPERYRCIKELLAPNGTLALFWNHPFPNRESDPTNAVNMQVYSKHRPGSAPQREFSEYDLARYISELEENGFRDVTAHIYRRTRTLSADDYIGLINTYSDHIALPKEQRQAFERDMLEGLSNVGGRINIYDTIDLYLAKI